jgi:predicted P-loop ATPase
MAGVVMPLQQLSRWMLGLKVNNRGVPLGNLRNVLFALRNAPEWQGVLAYDEFAARVITHKTLPWGEPRVQAWVDEHDTRACEWMQEQGIPAAAGVVGRAIQTVAREHRVHPVRSHLHALYWDLTPRLDVRHAAQPGHCVCDDQPGACLPLIR